MRRVALVVTIAVLYAWFVDQAIASEAIAALLTGVAVVLLHERLVRVAPPDARAGLAALKPLVIRVFPAMIRESAELLGPVLYRAVINGEDVRGRWIALRYDPHDREPADEHARRAIVIFGSNLTPNALPLDIDGVTGRLVLHQLVTRREEAAGHPRYPM